MKLLPTEWLAATTVRIVCDVPDGTSTGTGFLYAFLHTPQGHVPAIVTNKHVIAGATTIRFVLNEADADGQPVPGAKIEIALDGLDANWIHHPSAEVDLAVFPIGPLHGMAAKQNKKVAYSILTPNELLAPADLTDLQAMEDIVMIGYPNGIWDAHNNQPIFRRGVTATHPRLDYEGKKEFLIDAACFPGSSGSPVFLYNPNGFLTRTRNMMMGAVRIKLLGILFAGPVFDAKGDIVILHQPSAPKQVAVSKLPINLGVVVKASELSQFDGLLQKMLAVLPKGCSCNGV